MVLLAIFIPKVRRSIAPFLTFWPSRYSRGRLISKGTDGPGRPGVVVIRHRVKQQTHS
jgi:hypothetical protein